MAMVVVRMSSVVLDVVECRPCCRLWLSNDNLARASQEEHEHMSRESHGGERKVATSLLKGDLRIGERMKEWKLVGKYSSVVGRVDRSTIK